MNIYQIFIPELGTNVKFKVLPVKDAEDFVKKNKSVKDLRKRILQFIVYNLTTDVAAALASMSREAAERALEAVYAGCIMLNPSLDVDYWLNIAYSTNPAKFSDGPGKDYNIDQIKKFLRQAEAKTKSTTAASKVKKLNKQKFLGLEQYLKSNVIGQDEAIDEVVSALFRSQAELNDPNRPLGVFLFAGSSGVGKTHLANALHKYLFDDNSSMVRIDCGEYQHKHENQKLLGSPPGYIGHDDGGQLTNQIKKNPNTVVLIDEVEKAHADIWNTFLRIFPVPHKDRKIFFEYVTLSNKFSIVTDKRKDVVTDIMNTPFRNPLYSKINTVGRTWIFKYTLALAREIEAHIRIQFANLNIQGVGPLQGSELINDARTEKENLLTELKEMLNEVSRRGQLERKQQEAQFARDTMQNIPMTIYIM